MSDKINKKPAKNKPSTKKPPKKPSVNNKRVKLFLGSKLQADDELSLILD